MKQTITTVLLLLLCYPYTQFLSRQQKNSIQFTFFFLCSVLSLFGQDRQEDLIVDVQHFSTEDGLSHRDVNDIYQDSQGFIWIATKYGLNRFDGHDFKIFTAEKHGLKESQVNKIVEDAEGWLWIFSINSRKVNNLTFINSRTFEVKSVEERFSKDVPFEINELLNPIATPQGTIYLGSTDKIFQYHNGLFKTIELPKTGKIIFQDYTNNNELVAYAFTNNDEVELLVLDTLGNRLFSEFVSLHNTPFPTVAFYYHDSKYWLNKNSGQIFYKTKANAPFQYHDFSENLEDIQLESSFFTLFFLNDNSIWYKDITQFLLFSADNQLLFDFGKSHPQIVKSAIKNIYFDKKNNAWISTNFGCYKIQIIPNPFQNYLSQTPDDYNTLTAFSSRGLLVDDNQLWANSTFINQYKIDLKTKEQQLIEQPKNIFLKEGGKIVYRPVMKVDDGSIYTASDNLTKFQEGLAPKIYYWKNKEEQTMSWSLYNDAQNTVWLGLLDKGLAVLQGEVLTLFKHYNDFKDLSQSSIYHFLEWDEEHIFLSTTSGIYILHLTKGIIQRFWKEGTTELRIPHNTIHHLSRDKDNPNILWVATGGGGLLKLTIEEENWTITSQSQYTIVDGLSNNVIYAVYESKDDYKDNNLWMPSDYGIIQFNKETKATRTYTTIDGIPFNEFNRTSHCQATDGTLFFGTMNGVTSFSPKDLLGIKKKFDAPLLITDFQMYDNKKSVLLDHTVELIENKKIRLKPRNSYFILKFALLEYKNNEQVRYSYQLKGQNEDWIYLDDNQLRLSGLPYGRFTLNIKAKGVSGQFSESTLSIPVTVVQPIYLRWWFIIMIIIGISWSIYTYNKRKVQQLLTQRTILEKTVKERTAQIRRDKETIEQDKLLIESQAAELRNLDQLKSRFFANVSHELRTPLTLMLAPIETTLQENKLTNRAYTNLLMAQRNGQRLNRMINEILDLTKLEAGKLEVHPTKTVWYNFIRNILASFESLANKKNISFEFNYDANKYLQVLIDQKKVEIILLNLLSNAFKFTPKKGAVRFETTDEGASLKIKVTDTGQGIHPEDLPNIFNRFYQTKQNSVAQGGTGIGLALTKELTQLINGKIEVESEVQKGASFTIYLPKKEIISQISDEEAQDIAPETKTVSNLIPSQIPLPTPSSDTDTILLVEDNSDLRYFIQSLLSTKYKIITAENGHIALEKLKELKGNLPSLIISDIMMPIMDGYQLVKAVKNNPTFYHLPIIILTARAALEDKIKALRIGIDDYLVKPFVQEELFARIENLLHNAALRQIAKTKPPVVKPVSKKSTNKPTSKPKKQPSPASPELQEWLQAVETRILDNIEDTTYTIDQLSFDMGIGKRQLARRIKELVGVTPRAYIKTIRFTKARELLENGTYSTVKAVVYSVGLKDPVYFSRQFKEKYGKFPSEYLD